MECSYLNARLFKASSAMHGLEDASFDNLVYKLRDVFRLFGRYPPDLPLSGNLTPPWQALYRLLSRERQKGLIAFFGYCDQQNLLPTEVKQKVLDDFVTWTAEKTLHRDPVGRGRRAASNWEWARQHIESWPDIPLVRSGMREEYTLPFTAYPSSFQDDVEAFLDRYACRTKEEIFPDKVTDPTYKSFRSRRRPLSPRSVETRRYQIRQAAAALVAEGVPIESITNLNDLVQPVERVRTILLFHRSRVEERQRRQEELEQPAGAEVLVPSSNARSTFQDIRTSNLAGIGEALRQIAQFHCCVSEDDLALMKEWISQIKPPQQTSMTEKNTNRLRAFLDTQIYPQIIHYPASLMHRSSASELKPQAAARLALYAVAFEILTVCPLRRGNLAGLRLKQHVRRAKPDGPITHLHLRAEEVKNRKAIDWPLPPESVELIQRYLDQHRCHLAEPGNLFLFPGKGQRGRSGHDLGVGLTERFERDIGVSFNTHAMRHLAVVRFLIKHPGKYEIVRRILGHSRVETTLAFYSGPEMDRAIALLADVIRNDRREFGPPALSPPKKPRTKRGDN
ncbi:site-specific integrase [Roseomonas nepalensis]|uniref:Site-specific integrase n=2 Tax=Muricoccus nepalensis TaxID=1854500 RepID=A0A502FJC1_9PROT|nr:site-specific integrase [Roseomonas nepalensis]